MSDAPNLTATTPPPFLVQRRADRRAEQAAHVRLEARLQQYGRLLGLTSDQVTQDSIERGGDCYRNPSSAAQRVEAFELATELEASLPNHAGTALQTRVELVIYLLDPGGCERLTTDLRQARLVLGKPAV